MARSNNRNYNRSSTRSRNNSQLYSAMPKKRNANKKTLLILVTVSIAIALTLIFALGGGSDDMQAVAYADGWEVTLDGCSLGVVLEKETVDNIMDDMVVLLADQNKVVKSSMDLELISVAIDEKYICPDNIMKDVLWDRIGVELMAYVVLVNERPAVALDNNEDALALLGEILQPYFDNGYSDAQFVEKVTVNYQSVSGSKLMGNEAAYDVLTKGDGVFDNFYTVQSGDSLYTIAKRFNIKISDIRRANPSVATTDVIHPNQVLNVVALQNWINIMYTNIVQRTEELPFEKVLIKDPSKYITIKEVRQKGITGERDVTAQVTYINGIETYYEIKEEVITKASQSEIIIRGTKEITSIVLGATTGGFPLPLTKGYRISSEYGPRTLQGVKGFHHGVDLAAPPGTPIYASQSGTISYAGSASGYGLVVYINHGDGVQTRYGHCSKLVVKTGQKVKQGQLIALVGSTGHSTGPHVHFEIRVDGKSQNPLP